MALALRIPVWTRIWNAVLQHDTRDPPGRQPGIGARARTAHRHRQATREQPPLRHPRSIARWRIRRNAVHSAGRATEDTMDIPLIERIKIQAQALVPLVQALQAELGEER